MQVKIFKYIILFIGVTTLLQSCRLHRELHKDSNKDKHLLTRSKLDFEKNNKESDPNVNTYVIEDYIKQHPNRSFIINRWKPYTGIYLRSKDRFDSDRYKKNKLEAIAKTNKRFENKKIKNPKDSSKIEIKRIKKISKLTNELEIGTSLMQSINEPPAWFSDSLASLSYQQISLLMESHGYFEAQVDTITKLKRKNRVKNITYKVTANRPHKITSIKYDVTDDNIRALLKSNEDQSFLQENDNYRVNNISNERDRIYTLLKNNGYFDFHRQYVSFSIDTTKNRYKATIDVKVRNPAGSSHVQYRIDQVKVYIDKEKNNLEEPIIYNDVLYYHAPEKKYSKKILNDEIAIKPNELFSQEKSRFTKNNIGSLDIVKFININYLKTDSSNLTAFITIKTQKRFQVTSELGASLNVNAGQSIPGPYINFKIKDKKLFKGFESLEFNTNYTIQGQVSITQPDSLYTSREFGGAFTLKFPRLLIPNFIQKSDLLKRQNPFANNIYKQTKLNLGYSNVHRQEYSQSKFGVSMKYEWKKGEHQRYNLNLFDLSILNTPMITEEFSNYITALSERNGINIKQSFETTLLSNLTIGYMWNNIDMTQNKNSTMVRAGAELGGIIPHIIDNFSNADGKIFYLPFSKYYKLTADARKYIPVTKYSNLVLRIAGGFEKNILGSNFLPYEKYFFTGGVSSNRAWASRRIGPGNYNPSTSSAENRDFVKPGEILLEGNIEYRTKIYGFFHTAFFIDASNVWTNKEEESRPGSQFDITNIHNSIAIGAGSGIRLDFSLLILRLDLAWKIFDPATQKLVPFEILNPLYNLGIGYPF